MQQEGSKDKSYAQDGLKGNTSNQKHEQVKDYELVSNQNSWEKNYVIRSSEGCTIQSKGDGSRLREENVKMTKIRTKKLHENDRGDEYFIKDENLCQTNNQRAR